MFDLRILEKYVENHESEVFPFRLLTETDGLVYRNDLSDVLAIVVSQLIEGRSIVVMPSVKPFLLDPLEGQE